MTKTNVLACITFHFSQARLPYLRKTIEGLATLSQNVSVNIMTNDRRHEAAIVEAVQTCGLQIEIHVPHLLGHPYLLAWCHKSIFQKWAESDDIPHTHFIYLEDDILLTKHNLDYWIEGRERLYPHRLIPAFIRYEIHDKTGEHRCTDQWQTINPRHNSSIFFPQQNYAYISGPNPYQAMYIFDRELLREHFSSVIISGPDHYPSLGWYIREKAALGNTFINVPYGFSHKNLFGYDIKSQQIDKRCLIHHLPNNYANDARYPHVQLNVDSLVQPPISSAIYRSKNLQADGSIYRLKSPTFRERVEHLSKQLSRT